MKGRLSTSGTIAATATPSSPLIARGRIPRASQMAVASARPSSTSAEAAAPGSRIARVARTSRAAQAEAVHVRADRLRRVPRDPGEAKEARRRGQPALHRIEQRLLAALAREVGLAGMAVVVARAGEGERLLAVDVVGAALQAQRV